VSPELAQEIGSTEQAAGWHPSASSIAVGVTQALSIINDPTAPAGDRLRAMEQLESRALGKPIETVEHQDGKSEVDEALDRMSTEELEAIAREGRALRLVQDGGIEH
jgi:hypothetical protein